MRPPAREAMTKLRSSLPEGLQREPESENRVLADALTTTDKLEAVLTDAPTIPLTSQLRVDRDAAYDLIDQLRVVIPAQALRARLLVSGDAGESAATAVGNLFRSAGQLRELILGPRIINVSRTIEFDGVEVQGHLGELRSHLMEVQASLRGAGIDSPDSQGAVDLIDEIDQDVLSGLKPASPRTRLKRRGVAELLKSLDAELHRIVYSSV